MSLLAPARRRARTATMSHKFSCLATHRSSKHGRWVSLASCYLLPGSFRPFRPQNTLHSFDAQMMLNFTFIPVSLTSRDINSKLMRRPWMIMDDHGSSLSLAIISSAGYIPGLPLTRPPVAGHFSLVYACGIYVTSTAPYPSMMLVPIHEVCLLRYPTRIKVEPQY
jgi:hypothetical protein